MKYVLDTSALAALMSGEARVIERLGQTSRAEVGVPQTVLAEIGYGIERLPRSKRREALRRRLELLRNELTRCEWTTAVSDVFGETKAALERKRQPVEDLELATAAHALALDAVLVTANGGTTLRINGLKVEDWAT